MSRPFGNNLRFEMERRWRVRHGENHFLIPVLDRSIEGDGHPWSLSAIRPVLRCCFRLRDGAKSGRSLETKIDSVSRTGQSALGPLKRNTGLSIGVFKRASSVIAFLFTGVRRARLIGGVTLRVPNCFHRRPLAARRHVVRPAHRLTRSPESPRAWPRTGRTRPVKW